MLSEEFHNSHEFRKYTLVASSRALQNMRADVLNIGKLSNRFEVGEMRGREHIHHGKYGTTLSMYVVVNNRTSFFLAWGKYTQILKGMNNCMRIAHSTHAALAKASI